MTNPVVLHRNPDNTAISIGTSFVNDQVNIPNGPGAICPCCDGLCVVRKRKITSMMARVMVEMSLYEQTPADPYWDYVNNDGSYIEGWINIPKFLTDHPDPEMRACQRERGYARLTLWEVVQKKKIADALLSSDEIGDPRTEGYYRLVEKGRRFLRRESRLVRTKYVFRKRMIFQTDGRAAGIPREMVLISEALHDHFHFSEIIPPGEMAVSLEELRERVRRRQENE